MTPYLTIRPFVIGADTWVMWYLMSSLVISGLRYPRIVRHKYLFFSRPLEDASSPEALWVFVAVFVAVFAVGCDVARAVCIASKEQSTTEIEVR
jgi:hypothetical protein